MNDEMKRVADALSALRTPAAPEEFDLHAAIAGALTAAGVAFDHEYRLAPRCRIDLRVGRVGVEVKKGRPAPSQLKRQIARYLESDALDALLVVAQQAVPLPAAIGGKPVELLSLNRLWGVALP